MRIKKNPYPPTITDEVSGTKVPNEKHQIWEEGHQVGELNSLFRMTQSLKRAIQKVEL